MSPSGRRVAGVALVALLMASPVQAIIPDPIETGLLAKIAAALGAIEELRMRVLAHIQEAVMIRLNAYAFPDRLFGPIQATAETVVDVRREIQHLACSWPATPRTLPLQQMLLERVQFCRTGYQGIWGSHDPFWDGALQETNDYIGAMTANMLSERAEKTSTSWVQAQKSLFDEHTFRRSSPGEANRAEAAALAWANEEAIGNEQIVTQDLLVRQMSRSLDRFDEKKAGDLTYYAYQGLATLAGASWQGPPPDPTVGGME